MFIDGINTVVVEVKKDVGIAKGNFGIMYEIELPFTMVIIVMHLITCDEEMIRVNLN